MKIILTETIEKLGCVGEIINVKAGYAKNYLIPKNKALIINKKNLTFNTTNLKKTNETKLSIDKTLSNTSILLPVTAKANDNIYVNINSNKIIRILNKLNIYVKIKNLKETFSIKKLGQYKIELKTDTTDNINLYLITVKINK